MTNQCQTYTQSHGTVMSFGDNISCTYTSIFHHYGICE